MDPENSLQVNVNSTPSMATWQEMHAEPRLKPVMHVYATWPYKLRDSKMWLFYLALKGK